MNSNPLRVLIVDNQADAREWLAEWLRRKHEFDVETACNGVEAIECVAKAQGNYDVVLMDLLLGEGPDGIKTMQEIQGRYPYIETIIITGFGGIEEGVRAMKEGAYRYVLKPLNREELVVYVRHAAERHSLRADLERTAQKHQWLQGLLTVSQALSSRFDLEPTLDIIVAKLQELLCLDTCTIGLFDSDMTRLDFVAEQGLGKKVSKLLKDLPDDLIKQVFASSEILEIPEIDEKPNLKKALVRSDLRSFVILPLRGRNGAPLGLITMGSRGKITLSPDQKDLLRVLADQAAIGIENARLYQQAQTQAQQLDVVDEVTLKIASPMEIEELLPKIIKEATGPLGGAGGGLFLPTEDREQMELKAVYRLPDRLKGMRISKYEGVAGQVWKTEKPFTQPGYWNWEGRVKALDEFRFSAVVGIPIHSPQDNLLGVLVVHYLEECREFGQWKQEWLLRLGRHVGVMLEKTRILAEQDELSEVAQAVASKLDYRELFDKIVEVLQDRLGYGPSNFGVLLKPEFARNLDPELIRGLDPDGSDAIVDIQRGEVIKIGSEKGITGHAAMGRTVIVGDVTKDPRYLPLLPGCHSEIAVPIKISGNTIGVLNVESTKINAFDKRDERILSRFAAAIAIALDNSRLFDEVNRKTNRLALLLNFSKTVAEAQNLEEALQIVVEAMMRVCPSSYFHIMLRSREGNNLTVRAAARSRDVLGHWNPALNESCRLLGTLLSNQKWQKNFEDGDHIIIDNDDRANASLLTYATKRLSLQSALDSALIIPLRSGKKIFGLCLFWSTSREERGLFSKENIEFAVALAAQASAPIEKALWPLWLELEQEQTKVANLLREVATVVNSTLDLDDVLQQVLAQLQRLIPFDSASIQLLQGEESRLVACAGFGEEERNKVLQLAYPKADPKFPNSSVIQNKQPILVPDIRESRYTHFQDEADVYCSGHIRSWLGVPLLHRDEVLGMLSIESSTPHRYTGTHIDLGVAFASQVVSAVANAKLYKGTHRMLDFVEGLTKQLELQTVLKRIVEDAINKEGIIGADIAIIYLYDPDKGIIEEKPVYAGALRYPETINPPISSDSVVYAILGSQEPRISDRVVEDPFLSRAFVQREGVKSLAAFPLRNDEQQQLVGVMFINFLTPHTFDATEVDLMTRFACDATAAIQKARQFQVINERLTATRNAAVALSAMSAWAHDAAIDTYVLRSDATSLQNYILDPSPKALEILDRIKNIAEKIATLIPDAPADLDQRQPVVLGGVFRRILEQHATDIREKGIRIDSQLDCLPPVEANEWLLAEALNHLIHNALRFMNSGGKLSLSGLVQGKRLYITVADSGPGIAPEKREHLFKRRTSSTNGHGAGVGLMLTRLYLNACEGDIDFRSDDDGTTFVFNLPLAG